jgi:hypothetical protein
MNIEMLKHPSQPGLWQFKPDLMASLVIVGIGILFFADPLFSTKNLYFRDILSFHYPLHKVLMDSYSSGELPLWDPFIYLGQPMLANPNYMAFYPTNLFHLILPFDYAFKLHFLIHPILAGLGAYFLQRRLGICSLAALTGALAYEFSGTVLSFLNLYNLIPAVALLPWIAWAFYGAIQKHWLRRSLIFGALLGLQMTAAEPILLQCVLWALAGLLIFYLIEAKDRANAGINVLRVALVGTGFGFGLAATQVLPTLELLPLSARGRLGLVEAGGWSMHPLDLLNTLMPNLFGHYYTIGLNHSWGASIHEGREGYLVSFFLGACCLLLAAVSFAGRRKKLRWILSGCAFLGIFLALGKHNPLYSWLYDHIPFFDLGRYPSKYFLLSTLMICIMGSLGTEVLLDRPETSPKNKRWTIAVCGFLLAVLFLGFWQYLQMQPATVEGWLRHEIGPAGSAGKNFPALLGYLRQSAFSSGIYLLLGSAFIAAAPMLQSRRHLKALLPVLVAAELIPANLHLIPLISGADVQFVPEITGYIKNHGPKEPNRVVSPTLFRSDGMLPDLKLKVPNQSSAWLTLLYKRCGLPFHGITNGIQYSIYRPVDHLNTKESDALWTAGTGLSKGALLALFQKLNSPLNLSMGTMDDPRLRPLSSFDTQSDLPIHAYWLDNTHRRAFFVSGCDYVHSQKEALDRFIDPDFPAHTTVLLEGRGMPKTGEPESGTVRIIEYRNSRVICEVDSKTDGHLVLLDSYYPGWRARIDDEDVQVKRANYAFRAVEVPPGKHRVEFLYRPVLFYTGLTLSSVSLLMGLTLFTFTLFIRRRHR